MANILNIETSSKICSVAISSGENVIGSALAEESFTHARELTTLIQNLLEKHNMQLSDLDAVAVNSGPGSYTALRVGYSVAKGLCFGLDLKMLAHSSFEILFNCSSISGSKDIYDCIIPMIDARRDEVYMTAFEPDGSTLVEAQSFILNEEELKKAILTKNNILIIGDAADKAGTHLNGQEFHFKEVFLKASDMALLSWTKFQAEDWENVAYTIPFYLKPPNIVASKKRYF